MKAFFKSLLIISGLSLFIGCGKSPTYHYHHTHHLSREATSDVADWESKLASGQFLVRVTSQDFLQFHEAILNGVFDPNTVLSDLEKAKIGRSFCTSAPTNATIGLRRFERTLVIAPDFLVMADREGRYLDDWLRSLHRNDLLAVERAAQVQLATNPNRK